MYAVLVGRLEKLGTLFYGIACRRGPPDEDKPIDLRILHVWMCTFDVDVGVEREPVVEHL